MFDANVRRLTNHVYWMKAGEPDRPSLAAIVGSRRTVMLDAGASDEHARLFLDGLASHGVRRPDFTILTHWHWDHAFGAAAIDASVIAHRLTAVELSKMAAQPWDDAAIDSRVSSGEEIAFCADNIKLELPAPRTIHIAQPEIVFDDRLDLDLGGVECQVRHVGGDHAADSCVVYIPGDDLLFLGDCLYDNIYASSRHYTTRHALPLINTLVSIPAATYIEGHNPEPLDRNRFDALVGKMRKAADIVNAHRGDSEAISSALNGERPDEDLSYFVGAFTAGYALP